MQQQNPRARVRGVPGPWGDPPPDEARALTEGLGALLRTRRREAGLSQSRLAERAGSHRGTVAKLERGLRRPTSAMLACLAAAVHPEDVDAARVLHEELVAAAGSSLTESTPGGLRRRDRRIERVRRRLAWAARTLGRPVLDEVEREVLGLDHTEDARIAHTLFEPVISTGSNREPLPPRPDDPLDVWAHDRWLCAVARRAGVPAPPSPDAPYAEHGGWWSMHRAAVERVVGGVDVA